MYNRTPITLSAFKALYPKFTDFKTKVIDPLVALQRKDAKPDYLNEAKMYFNFETIYTFLSIRYSEFVAVNTDEKQNQLMIMALQTTLPGLYVKTLKLSNEMLEKFDLNEILKNVNKTYNEDPENKYLKSEIAYSSQPDNVVAGVSFAGATNIREKEISSRKDGTIKLRELSNFFQKYREFDNIDVAGVINEFVNGYEFSSLWANYLEDNPQVHVIACPANDIDPNALWLTRVVAGKLVGVSKLLPKGNETGGISVYYDVNGNPTVDLKNISSIPAGVITTFLSVVDGRVAINKYLNGATTIASIPVKKGDVITKNEIDRSKDMTTIYASLDSTAQYVNYYLDEARTTLVAQLPATTTIKGNQLVISWDVNNAEQRVKTVNDYIKVTNVGIVDIVENKFTLIDPNPNPPTWDLVKRAGQLVTMFEWQQNVKDQYVRVAQMFDFIDPAHPQVGPDQILNDNTSFNLKYEVTIDDVSPINFKIKMELYGTLSFQTKLNTSAIILLDDKVDKAIASLTTGLDGKQSDLGATLVDRDANTRITNTNQMTNLNDSGDRFDIIQDYDFVDLLFLTQKLALKLNKDGSGLTAAELLTLQTALGIVKLTFKPVTVTYDDGTSAVFKLVV